MDSPVNSEVSILEKTSFENSTRTLKKMSQEKYGAEPPMYTRQPGQQMPYDASQSNFGPPSFMQQPMQQTVYTIPSNTGAGTVIVQPQYV